MEEITEYLGIKEIQSLEKQGAKPEFTGWEENTGIQKLYEVRYRPIQKTQKLHICRLFDLVKISDENYKCQVCHKLNNQEAFNKLKKLTPVKFCCCDGFMKQMQVYIPHPMSGWETRPVFYVCNTCGGKYMYHRFACETENCNNTCDISEVYCQDCRTQK